MGARSIDKAYRIEGKTWWKAEEPNVQEIEEALTNLKKINYKVDYVITHCGPWGRYSSKICKTEEFLGVLALYLQYSSWYCGHYHVDDIIEKYTSSIIR